MSGQFDVIYEKENWREEVIDPTKISFLGSSTFACKKPMISELFESLLKKHNLQKIDDYIILRVEKSFVDKELYLFFTFIEKEFYRQQ